MKTSVCMATYNGMPYIKDQLASILSQLDFKDEIIVSDDSSTDETINVIKNFNDPRIKLYFNHVRNPIFNFENALKKSKGDLIFLSDQDDLWIQNKKEIVSELLKSFDLVVSDCQIIDEKGIVIDESFFNFRNSGKGFLKNFMKNSYLGCCMAMKRHIIEKALPFPKLIPMHDMWLGLIGELYGKTYFCNQKLVKYRRHGKNETYTAEKSQTGFFKKMIWRYRLGVCLLTRYWALLNMK